jgi:muramoyltetrapeptide carboxypeptidase
MQRKKFLGSLLLAGAGLPALAAKGGDGEDDAERVPVVPHYLRAGDWVGITCPAGYITEKEIQPCVIRMEEWGLRVKAGSTVGKKDFTFGGTDAERMADFQQMLDDPSLKAIMCARGGYGSVRIIDRLDFSRFLKKPKWIIGFSDVTVIHSHLNRNFGIATIHSKMCNSFPEEWEKAEPEQVDSILSIRQALTGEKMKYNIPPNDRNRNGSAQGTLVGGNLKTIESLSGSRSDIKTAGKILFLEDTGEYLYSLDRMFWNLKRTGKLSGLRGLILGGFKIKPDDPGEEFGRSLQDIVMEKVAEYSYPVCFDFPIGHQKFNMALKCGVLHRLTVKSGEASLSEIR